MTHEDLHAAAVQAVRDLADCLSDLAADAAADRGAMGHRTPPALNRLYALADVIESEYGPDWV